MSSTHFDEKLLIDYSMIVLVFRWAVSNRAAGGCNSHQSAMFLKLRIRRITFTAPFPARLLFYFSFRRYFPFFHFPCFLRSLQG